MKIRLWHIALFVVALLTFAVVRAPASAFARQQPGVLTYMASSGTIWAARFEGVHLGPYPVSLATWRLSFGDLVQSRLVADMGFSGGAIDGDARILGNWRGDRRLVINSMAIEGAPLGGAVMLSGATRITGLDVHFEGGQCRVAQGAVESDVLARNGGPELSGNAVCAGEIARIDLNGPGDGQTALVSIELHPNGEGRWRAGVGGNKMEAQVALAAAGFQPNAGGVVEATGEMRWLPF